MFRMLPRFDLAKDAQLRYSLPGASAARGNRRRVAISQGLCCFRFSLETSCEYSKKIAET